MKSGFKKTKPKPLVQLTQHSLQEDTTFTVNLRLKMINQSPSDITSHDVTKTCSYSRWASREVLCDRNYMEVGQQHPIQV